MFLCEAVPAVFLAKVRLAVYGQNACHMLAAGLSGTAGMNQALGVLAVGLISKVMPAVLKVQAWLQLMLLCRKVGVFIRWRVSWSTGTGAISQLFLLYSFPTDLHRMLVLLMSYFLL